MTNPALAGLNETDRTTLVEVFDEIERRQLRWPCTACTLRDLGSEASPLQSSCTHDERIGEYQYEAALRQLRG